MFYTVGELIRNGKDKLLTLLFWKGARLVRRPFIARNKKNIHCGKGMTTGVGCRMTAGSIPDTAIRIGRDFCMGDYCQMEGQGGIQIGENVLLGSRVLICTTCHGTYSGENQDTPDSNPRKRRVTYKKIVIGDNVWIGNGVVVLPGRTIGSGAVIGANSVVGIDVPDACMAMGNPAKIVKKYNPETKEWERV